GCGFDPWPHSVGGGIWHCCDLWCGLQTWLGSRVAVAVGWASGRSSNSAPSLGPSVCRGCSPEKTKERSCCRKSAEGGSELGGRWRCAHLSVRAQVKSQLEEKENKTFPVFKAVEFKSQVVAGRNLFIKVQVDDDDFVHLRVFESLPHENKPLTLSSYQTNKSRHDELTYF
uniref:Cystatin B n=2 Tax=Sus scrofa TaxID=9823 RepID=A0A4X1TD05_PIG